VSPGDCASQLTCLAGCWGSDSSRPFVS
jgi:hypothetical protein